MLPAPQAPLPHLQRWAESRQCWQVPPWPQQSQRRLGEWPKSCARNGTWLPPRTQLQARPWGKRYLGEVEWPMTSAYVTVGPAFPSALHPPTHTACRPHWPSAQGHRPFYVPTPRTGAVPRGRGCSRTPCLRVSKGTEEATGPSPLQPRLLGQETAASPVTPSPSAGSPALRELSDLLAPLWIFLLSAWQASGDQRPM